MRSCKVIDRSASTTISTLTTVSVIAVITAIAGQVLFVQSLFAQEISDQQIQDPAKSDLTKQDPAKQDPQIKDWTTEEALKKGIDLHLNKASYNPKAAVDSMYSLSLLYVKHQRITDLSTLLEKALPLSVEVLGEANPRTQQMREFKVIAQTAAQTESRWNSYMGKGLRAMKAGNYEQATSSYEGALQIIEKSAPGSKALGVTLSVLGTAYLKDGQYKRAEKTLNKALPIYQEFFVNDPDQIDTLKAGIEAAQDGQGGSSLKKDVIGPALTDDAVNSTTKSGDAAPEVKSDGVAPTGESKQAETQSF